MQHDNSLVYSAIICSKWIVNIGIIPQLVIFIGLQQSVLTSARMEEPVQLQIAAPALVDGLGSLAVTVCENMNVFT